jgi:hypothetical protein
MEVPDESICRSSWESRTCYPWPVTNQGLAKDKGNSVYTVTRKTKEKSIVSTSSQSSPPLEFVAGGEDSERVSERLVNGR